MNMNMNMNTTTTSLALRKLKHTINNYNFSRVCFFTFSPLSASVINHLISFFGVGIGVGIGVDVGVDVDANVVYF